jgi:hypothetical protein
MFNLFGAEGVSEITAWGIAAMFLTALLQVNGLAHNMAIGGSARGEFAARFGAVAGTFGKRLMVILWTFAGLKNRIDVTITEGELSMAETNAKATDLSQDADLARIEEQKAKAVRDLERTKTYLKSMVLRDSTADCFPRLGADGERGCSKQRQMYQTMV